MKLCSKLFIVFSLVVILVCCLVGTTAFAYADYEDLSSDTIVNFNQLISVSSIAGVNSSHASLVNGIGFTVTSSLSNGAIFYLSNYITLDSSHYYFIKSNYNSSAFRFVSSSGSTLGSWLPNTIQTGSSYTISYLNYNSAYGSYNVGNTYYYNIIDLTKMYGSGFEPSLSQCKEIFTADYYSYNTGTAMSINGVDSYQQGVSDTLDSLNYSIVAFDSYNNLFPLNIGSYSSAIQKEFDTSTTPSYYCLVYNYAGLPLNATLKAGSSIHLTGYFGYYGQSVVYYGVLYNNQVYNIGSYTLTGNSLGAFDSVDFYFSLPYDTDTIIFYTDVTSGNPYCLLGDIELSFVITDYSQLASTAYNNGYNKASSYYSTGNAGYNAIYNAGYSAGLEAETPYTFGYLMSSVIEAPLNAILDIFNFDFLGVNFKNVITLVMTLMIIISIVRLFMGGE